MACSAPRVARVTFSAGITSTVPIPRETLPLVPTAGTGLAGGFCASAVAVIASSEKLRSKMLRSKMFRKEIPRSEKSIPENRDHTDWDALVIILYSSGRIKSWRGWNGGRNVPRTPHHRRASVRVLAPQSLRRLPNPTAAAPAIPSASAAGAGTATPSKVTKSKRTVPLGE